MLCMSLFILSDLLVLMTEKAFELQNLFSVESVKPASEFIRECMQVLLVYVLLVAYFVWNVLVTMPALCVVFHACSAVYASLNAFDNDGCWLLLALRRASGL